MDNSLQVENTKSTYEIVGVKFNDTSKSYYFDPDGLKIPEGAHVIVDTMHGPEFGTVTISNKTVNESELVLPLKKVIRVATDNDEVVNAENKAKEAEAEKQLLQTAEWISENWSKILLQFLKQESN